jgi:cellulose synthase/poly-beta-1,6-N-acetylglucosamine synthase-like glycosyltransferase
MGRLEDVQELLDTLLSQTYPKLEVVFVGERDLELCRRVEAYAFEKGMQNLRVVFNRGAQGLAPARTLGVKHSQGEIIAFIDDDAIAFPDWADSIVRIFRQNESAIGVTGPAQPIWREEGLSWLPEELYWLVSCTSPHWAGPDTLREVRSAWGVNSAFRREAFESRSFSEIFVGGNQGLPNGVKAGLLGDETEFSIRVSAETKRPIYYSPCIRVSHKVYASRLTSRFIRRRAFWEGYTKAVLRRICRAQMSIWLDMSMEHTLLRRIVLYLLPSLVLLSVKSPRTGWPGLRSTLTVLFSVGLGYFAGKAPLVGRWISRRYS